MRGGWRRNGRKATCVKQGDLTGGLNGVRAKSLRRAGSGVRVPIVAMKRSNVRGAKGCRKVDCVKDRGMDQHSAAVSKTKQAEEIRDRWSWVKPCVWTDRMLTALEKGVKGGKWFALIDKVYSKRNLRAAFEKVKANKGSAGVDHVTISSFEKRLDDELDRLRDSLREQTYRPQRIQRTYIKKLGSKKKRPLGIPTVRDRVVQTALRNVLEPIFERDFSPRSYGFRPGRGCKDALRHVQSLLNSGRHFVVDADLKSYFDTIPKDRLMDRVREKISDGRVLDLIEFFLNQEVLKDLEIWTPETGTPQGAVISPLLANIYLDELDHLMDRVGCEVVRYADDFVILCTSPEDAEHALGLVQEWVASAGLALNTEKTHIVDVREPGGFDFLGYNFAQGRRWPRQRSLKKFKDTIRSKTRRCHGHSLDHIIEKLNQTIRGWFEYFKHSHRYIFERLDRWIRMRLRSILRKRRGGRGRGRGIDHHRWPNAFFAKHGLLFMTTARAKLVQSSRR